MLEAITLAGKHGIRFAISNPCFELWLILHFRDHTGFLSTVEAERLCTGLDGFNGKHMDPDVYLPLRMAAARRAANLDRAYERDETRLLDRNPSSTVYELVAFLETPPAAT